MKRFTLLTFLLFAYFGAFAQTITVKSFQPLPMDMTALSLEGKRIDQNGHVAALIKIVTSETGFAFDGGTLGIVDTKQKVGEIWVWVPYGSRKISIMHQQLGVLRDYRYPIEIESECTYEMVLTTGKVETIVKQEVTQQYLAFQISPTNAVLEVEGELWEVASDGSAMKFVNFGTYNYRVQAPNYHPEIGKVTVNDPDKTQKVIVTLEPDFVEVTLKVDADAEIWVNNEKKGTCTWTGNLGKGNYKIECKQAGHETSMITKEITADMNGQTIDLPKPIPVYGSLNIESTPNFATIYIDGKKVGETPKFVKEILVGRHEVKLLKEGHEDYNKSVEITRGCNIQVVALLEKYSAQHLYDLGIEYFNSQNYENAIKCYIKAAEQGLPEAQNELGNMYYFGWGVERDFSKAFNYYRNAAKAGYVDAQNSLGQCYLLGKGVDRDDEEAIKWIKRAAEQGNVYAQNSMGQFYYVGLAGLSQNYTEAVRWYQKAANQGDSWAQNNLGCMYLDGQGVDVNYFESTKYFRLSAEQGHASAQYNLGLMYENGYGVQKSVSEAVKWYQKAANQGEENAQCKLGLCYYYGNGVSINYSEASKWLHLAAKKGNEYAKTLIKDLNL